MHCEAIAKMSWGSMPRDIFFFGVIYCLCSIFGVRKGEDYNFNRICESIDSESERGQAASGADRLRRRQRAYLHRQAKRKGFQPSGVHKADAQAEIWRHTRNKKHRPSGAELSGNSRGMAYYYA